MSAEKIDYENTTVAQRRLIRVLKQEGHLHTFTWYTYHSGTVRSLYKKGIIVEIIKGVYCLKYTFHIGKLKLAEV